MPRRYLKPTIKMVEDPVIRAYVAGIFDGEGSIGIVVHKKSYGARRYPRPHVTIVNTNKQLLDFIHNTFGGQKVASRPPTDGVVKGNLPLYTWTIGSHIDVAAFLEMILPYLIVKREKAEEVLKFCVVKLTMKKSCSRCAKQEPEVAFRTGSGARSLCTDCTKAFLRLYHQARKRGEHYTVKEFLNGRKTDEDIPYP